MSSFLFWPIFPDMTIANTITIKIILLWLLYCLQLSIVYNNTVGNKEVLSVINTALV